MLIRYLLLHAYGTGGTIRTVFNQAAAMAEAGHRAEIVSVVRRRDEPVFAPHPGVALSALVDLRGDPGETPPRGPLGRYRAWADRRDLRREAAAVPRGEFAFPTVNRYVEKKVIGYLAGLRDGIVVTTRPALNLLSARYAAGGAVRVAQEHMNLATHRKDVRAAIARHYGGVDAVAVLTERDRADYQKLLPGTRVVRIPNAVHSLEQQPSTQADPVAVAAGRLVRQKGFDLLIPAFGRVVERYPDWQLRIYGNGERRGELRELIERHHLYNSVFLMGHSSDLDAELAKASFYVLSSRFEGLPMVMIEAMAHALPVVAFDCPTGPADVITDGVDGLLVPAQDVDGLARAMCRLAGDPGERAGMGAAALRTARDYAPGAVAPRWEELFRELLAGRGARRS
ncbi:glycosyltransferase family 4 protein [Allonocardiopsis opalescens]|uniref:Glycosyltransferase involved in cell wall biosynthesis n=1 Tax=Allonocardiopsis opalescens TaxID=1144618 RepID=A0A2T0QEE3_9ACTN|nr:glycosyltransferase family 4 protein [Allonocardiopsis opalescens]PRY02288.1 glycosyltransferase involved in cell wall biosynthesis [Allonocardiopsis opalescens]